VQWEKLWFFKIYLILAHQPGWAIVDFQDTKTSTSNGRLYAYEDKLRTLPSPQGLHGLNIGSLSLRYSLSPISVKIAFVLRKIVHSKMSPKNTLHLIRYLVFDYIQCCYHPTLLSINFQNLDNYCQTFMCRYLPYCHLSYYITIFVNLGRHRHFETITNIRTWIKSHKFWRML
jgi:hypothetical protein